MPMKASWVRPLFLFAGLYDMVLGVAFFLAFKPIYERFTIPLPNHDAYVQLPAALIAIFGIGFWFVSRAPERNRDLITLGVLMKFAFSGIVLSYALRDAIPPMWVPLAWIDVAFMVAFIAALQAPAPGAAKA
jgi:hypothetical protein